MTVHQATIRHRADGATAISTGAAEEIRRYNCDLI
jgi:hypothetical protein